MKNFFNYLIITVFSSALAMASNVSDLQEKQEKYISPQIVYDLDDTSSDELPSNLILEQDQYFSPSYSFSEILTSSITYFTDLYKTMLSVKEEQPSKIYLPYFPEEIWKSIFKFLTEEELIKVSSITKGLRQTIMPMWTSDCHITVSSNHLPHIKEDLLFVKNLGFRHVNFYYASIYIDLLETLGSYTNLTGVAFKDSN